jgi:hypothetical protein
MKDKKEAVWESFLDAKFRERYYGRISQEEYDLAEQFVKEGKSYSMTFQEWLDKKNV